MIGMIVGNAQNCNDLNWTRSSKFVAGEFNLSVKRVIWGPEYRTLGEVPSQVRLKLSYPDAKAIATQVLSFKACQPINSSEIVRYSNKNVSALILADSRISPVRNLNAKGRYDGSRCQTKQSSCSLGSGIG